VVLLIAFTPPGSSGLVAALPGITSAELRSNVAAIAAENPSALTRIVLVVTVVLPQGMKRR
jgi:hypothetical protein